MPDLDLQADFSELEQLDRRTARLAQRELPQALERLLESLGEILLQQAQEVFRTTKRPHARYKAEKKRITRGKNKGRIRERIGFASTVSTNSVDTGELWSSLSRGNPDNHWKLNKSTGNLSLEVGTNVEYASLVENDVHYRKRHWVPGVVDSNGIFRYQNGARTGIMVCPHTRKGLHYFELGMDELKRVAPGIVNQTIEEVFRHAGW